MGPQEAESDEQGIRPCYCGSGKPSDWFRDPDRDVEVARVCDDCRERVVFAYGYDIHEMGLCDDDELDADFDPFFVPEDES